MKNILMIIKNRVFLASVFFFIALFLIMSMQTDFSFLIKIIFAFLLSGFFFLVNYSKLFNRKKKSKFDGKLSSSPSRMARSNALTSTFKSTDATNQSIVDSSSYTPSSNSYNCSTSDSSSSSDSGSSSCD